MQKYVYKGKISGYTLYHNAYALTKAEYKAVKLQWNESILNTMHQKFRSITDVSIFLIRYYRLESGVFVPRTPKFDAYYSLNEIDQLANELQLHEHSLLCINDADTVNYDEKGKRMVEELNKQFPQKSRYER